MPSEFANLCKGMARRPTIVNIEQALAMAHAESSKAGSSSSPSEKWYAWNRVIHALWDVQRLEGDTDAE